MSTKKKATKTTSQGQIDKRSKAKAAKVTKSKAKVITKNNEPCKDCPDGVVKKENVPMADLIQKARDCKDCPDQENDFKILEAIDEKNRHKAEAKVAQEILDKIEQIRIDSDTLALDAKNLSEAVDKEDAFNKLLASDRRIRDVFSYLPEEMDQNDRELFESIEFGARVTYKDKRKVEGLHALIFHHKVTNLCSNCGNGKILLKLYTDLEIVYKHQI